MRIARQFQWWNPASATLETPLQKLPFRLMAIAWYHVVAVASTGAWAMVELIDGSGIVIWRSRAWLNAGATTVQISFGVNQPGAFTDTLLLADSASGHIPPDLWVMPNERIRVSLFDNSPGTTVMFSLAFPDEIEAPAKRRSLDRGTDGKPVPKKRRKKRK